MADELVPIAKGLSAERAESLKRMLEEREVEAYAAPCEAVRGEWNLLAAPELADRAARFVEQASDELDALDGGDPESILDDRQWRQWPKCPVCDWRRMTRCEFCGAVGHHFPVADGAPDSEYAPVLLMCETCDEPFEPQFLNHCDRCHEPFPDGVDFHYAAAMDIGNPRVGFAAIGMLVLGAALFAYWWWIG